MKRIFILILLLVAVSCSTVKYVPVETIEKIDQFLSRGIDVYAFDYGEFIEGEQGDDEPITVGKNVKISLADMRVEDWRETLVSDQTAIEHLIRRVVTIDAAHDNKLKKLIVVNLILLVHEYNNVRNANLT